MEYQFKKFEGRNIRLEDRITVTKSHSIGFPTKFYLDNKIKDFGYVVLFWDSENKAIGIQFTNDESEKNKFKVTHSKAGYGGSLVVRSFFRAYGIDPNLYHGRYEWEKYPLGDNTGHMFVIKLKEKKNNPK